MAELPLARAHGHGRVALGQLDRVEALGDGALHVLVGHVLADADEALALLRGAVERGCGNGDVADLAGGRADDLDPVGEVGGDEDPAPVVVLDLRARVGEERVGGLAPAGHDEQVAVDLAAVELDRGQAPGAALRRDLPHPGLAQVDDLRHLGAGLLEQGDGVERALVGAHHDGAPAGLQRPAPDEPAHGLGEDDADQVVAGEDQRLLDGARGDDDLPGAVAEEQVAGVHRDEAALEDAERDAVHDLEPLAGVEAGGVALDHDDLPALGGVGSGRLAAGGSRADHQHLGAAVLDVVAALAAAVLVDLPEPGDVAQELLVERPRAARVDHRPVVEADRRERTADLVGDRQQVVVERAAHVLRLHLHPGDERRHARADVRRPVDGEHAVRAGALAAEEPARAVVLEAAREHALPLAEERRGDRVALEPARGGAVERELELAPPVEALAWLRREPHFSAGTSTERTSFVRVSRSAVNQAWQPWRWRHHSRCTPAALRLK